MNWKKEYKIRKKESDEINKQIRQLNRRLKEIGSTNTRTIIGEAVGKKLNLRFRYSAAFGGFKLFSRNKKGHYHADPDYICEIFGDGTKLRYYDSVDQKEKDLPEDTDEIADMIITKRFGMYPLD